MISEKTQTSEPVTRRTPSFEMGEPVSQAERWRGVHLITAYRLYAIANTRSDKLKSYTIATNARSDKLKGETVEGLIDRTREDINTNYSGDLQKRLEAELIAATLTYDHPEIERKMGLGFNLDELRLAA